MYIEYIFQHLLENDNKFLFMTFKRMSQVWKNHQFVNYRNNIEKNTKIYWNWFHQV